MLLQVTEESSWHRRKIPTGLYIQDHVWMGQNGELARMKQPELSVRLSPGLAATGRRPTVSPVTRVTRRGGKERSGFAFLRGPGNRPLSETGCWTITPSLRVFTVRPFRETLKLSTAAQGPILLPLNPTAELPATPQVLY